MTYNVFGGMLNPILAVYLSLCVCVMTVSLLVLIISSRLVVGDLTLVTGL